MPLPSSSAYPMPTPPVPPMYAQSTPNAASGSTTNPMVNHSPHVSVHHHHHHHHHANESSGVPNETLRRKRPRSPAASESHQLLSFARLADAIHRQHAAPPVMASYLQTPASRTPLPVASSQAMPLPATATPMTAFAAYPSTSQRYCDAPCSNNSTSYDYEATSASQRSRGLPTMADLLNSRHQPIAMTMTPDRTVLYGDMQPPVAKASRVAVDMKTVPQTAILHFPSGEALGATGVHAVYKASCDNPVQPSGKQGNESAEQDEVEDKTPWPSAAQYHEIFKNQTSGQIPVYDLGVDARGVPLHPEFIYSQPVSCMYFLKCKRLLGKGSFGFPRKKKSDTDEGAPEPRKKQTNKGKKESSKDFEWRKMSFVTGLPKKQPLVRYITATCYSRATDFCAKKKVFRMHAVMLADASGNGETGDYVLVHIRAGGSKRVGVRAGPTEAEAPPMKQSSPFGPSPTQSKRPISPPSEVISIEPTQPGKGTADSNGTNSVSTLPVSTSSVVPPRASSNRPVLVAQSVRVSNQGSESTQPTVLSHHHAPLTQMLRPTIEEPAPMSGNNTEDRKGADQVSRIVSDENDPHVANAKQMLRSMLLQSCSSRDEMAKYVRVLQEELEALKHQNP